MILEKIQSPADLRGLDPPRARDPGRRDPPVHRRLGDPGRQRPPGLQPRRGRADAGAAPGVRLAATTSSCGTPATRPTSTRSSPGAGPTSPRCARPTACRATRAGPRAEHDWIENSHASTVLSYAYGLATAEQSSPGHHRRVIAVIGDGSMTGGMAFEGLNNLGHSGRDCIIVLNDNGRSYAPTVSRLGESLARIRNNPVYMRRQARIERLLQEVPMLGDRLERGLEATKAAIREMWEPTGVLRDPRRPLHRPVRRPRHRRRSRRRSATRPRSAARRSSTCSRRRAAATRRPRTTPSSGCTTSACPSRAATPPRSPRR